MEIDVAVIGGGFAGLSTARQLALRGTSVVVFERDLDLGTFASGRGAGLGRQLAEDDATSQLAIRGAELLRGGDPALAAAWTPTGGVLTFDDLAAAQTYLERAARLGVPAEPLAREAVLALWPTLPDLPIAAAIRVAGDGVIDVKVLLAAYAAALPGTTIQRGVGITSAVAGGRGVVLKTARGETVSARVVVDAAGAWAGAPTADPPLLTYKRHLFVLSIAPAGPAVPFLWHLGARELYVRADGENVLASPCDAARIEPTDQQPDLVGESHLRAVFELSAPDLADAPIVRRWACHRAFTDDRKMRLGRDATRPWLVWAAGLGGHGATASPAVGERVAAAVLEALG